MLTALAFASVAVSASGQGNVNIGTTAGANTKFITTYTGERIAGEAFWAQLFYANGVVTDETLLVTAGNAVHPRTGAAAGVIPSGELRLEGVSPPGGVVTLQLRAWSAVFGYSHDQAYEAWQSLAPNPSRVYGRSGLFQLNTLGPFETPPGTPPSLGAAFPEMTLFLIPEPSTIVLGMLAGAGALVALRRRKQ